MAVWNKDFHARRKHMHSGARSSAKKGTTYAEKGHFTYKFVKKWGAGDPCVPGNYDHYCIDSTKVNLQTVL